MRRIISVLLTVVMLVGAFYINVAAESSPNDSMYCAAVTLLSAMKVLPEGDARANGSFVTRGEFSDLILRFIGMKSSETSNSEIVDGKYVDYANRKPEKDDWLWIDEAQSSQLTQGFTPYYDVSKEHEYWDSINTVSQIGLMNGDSNRCFRPDERITLNEVMKVLVTLVGAEVIVEGNYPVGYVSQATRLDINKGVKAKDFSEFVTYRDLVIMFFNTLESDVYVAEPLTSNGGKYRRSDKPYRESVLGIYKKSGVVTNNCFTGDDGIGTDAENRIKVNEIYFDAADFLADDYLGYEVSVYYHGDDFNGNLCENVICILKSDKNKEFVIDSKEIVGYSKPNLQYNSEKRVKEVYIGADSTIIYNGKLLDDYNETNLTPENGSIRLVDNDGDGKYEYVFINNVETMVVGGTDVNAKVIYDKLHPGKTVELDGKDYIIQNSGGEEISFENIFNDNVLDIRQSINKNGEKYIQIAVSDSLVKGKVTAISEDTDEVVINNKTYEVSVFANFDEIKLGTEGAFYLDTKGRIVCQKLTEGLRYGYLISIYGRDFPAEYLGYIYTLDDNFGIYEFAEKIKIDGNLLKNNEAYKKLASAADNKFRNGVIKYELNDEGKISKLMFPDENGDDFITLASYDSEKEVQYRDSNSSFNLPEKSLCFKDSDTVYINVPFAEEKNEDAFFRINYSGDDYIRFHKIFADKKDSKTAKVIVWYRDIENVKTVSNNEICFMLESKYSKIDQNGETVMALSGVSSSGTVEFEVDDSALIKQIEDLSVGDLFRVTTNVATGRVQAYEKVFDADERCFVSKRNPTGSAEGLFVNSQYHVLHGMAYQNYDNGVYLDVAPYIYTTNEKGETTVGDADSTNVYPYKTQDFTIVVYDGDARKKVFVGSYMTDILVSEIAGINDASEVVVNSWWGSPRTIFVYK